MDLYQPTILTIATLALAVFTALMWWSTRNVSFGTMALARETAELAKDTSKLARETLRGSELADRHHQESMTAMVILENGVLSREMGRLHVGALLHNIGPGIALNVRVWIGEIGEKIAVGPLASNGTRQISCAVSVGSDHRQQQPLKIALVYDNLFMCETKTEYYGIIDRIEAEDSVFKPPQVASRVTPANDVPE